jgi:hypothetical protein
MEQSQQDKNNKFGIGDRFVTAMFLPKEYKKLLEEKARYLVGFAFLLILLTTFIQYVIPTLGAIAGMGGIKNIMLHGIPTFQFENGQLMVEEKFERSDEATGVYIVVDTSVKKYTKDDIPTDAVEAILVSSTNALVYSQVSGLGGMADEMNFKDMKDITISNQTLADASASMYGMLMFIYVSLYMGTGIRYVMMALMYAAIMFILSKMLLPDITFGKVYKTALYAQAIGMIVLAVTYCINNALLIMAGGIFSTFTVLFSMNKVFIHMKMEEDAIQKGL